MLPFVVDSAQSALHLVEDGADDLKVGVDAALIGRATAGGGTLDGRFEALSGGFTVPGVAEQGDGSMEGT